MILKLTNGEKLAVHLCKEGKNVLFKAKDKHGFDWYIASFSPSGVLVLYSNVEIDGVDTDDTGTINTVREFDSE